MKRSKFTLVELLVVITIIAILAFAMGSAISTAVDQAKVTEAKAVLNGVETALKTYYQTYNRPPKELEDMLKRNNRRGMEFFDNDEIPSDPLSTTGNAKVKMIAEVSKAVPNPDKDGFESIELDGSGIVIYSVGLNAREDGEGAVQGGINDGIEEGKDDLAVFVSF